MMVKILMMIIKEEGINYNNLKKTNIMQKIFKKKLFIQKKQCFQKKNYKEFEKTLNPILKKIK